MNQLRFIQDTLYELKLNYGTQVTLIKVTNVSTEFRSGNLSSTQTEYKIRKAILLESGVVQVLLSSIITENSKYSGQILRDKKSIIVDKYDLPRDLTISQQDQFLLHGQLYTVDSILKIDRRRGYLITLNHVVGDDMGQSASDSISFTGGAVHGP